MTSWLPGEPLGHIPDRVAWERRRNRPRDAVFLSGQLSVSELLGRSDSQGSLFHSEK